MLTPSHTTSPMMEHVGTTTDGHCAVEDGSVDGVLGGVGHWIDLESKATEMLLPNPSNLWLPNIPLHSHRSQPLLNHLEH